MVPSKCKSHILTPFTKKIMRRVHIMLLTFNILVNCCYNIKFVHIFVILNSQVSFSSSFMLMSYAVIL